MKILTLNSVNIGIIVHVTVKTAKNSYITLLASVYRKLLLSDSSW
jgi:hypothetical protein